MKENRVIQALVLGACALFACRAPLGEEETGSTEHSIVGGTVAQPGAWPGVAALYKGSTQVCGGTLVADEWVLTAAHCISSGTNGGFSKVVIGRHDLTTSVGESITVKKAF